MKNLVYFALCVVIILAYACNAIPNYRECKARGFSTRYCATTQLIR